MYMLDTRPFIGVTNVCSPFTVSNDSRIAEFAFSVVHDALFYATFSAIWPYYAGHLQPWWHLQYQERQFS